MSLNDIQKSLLIYAMNLFPDFQTLDFCHYSIFDAVFQTMYILIRDDYAYNSPKKSIWQHVQTYDESNADNFRGVIMRRFEFSQFYRKLWNDRIEQSMGFRIPELDHISFSGGSANFEGYELTDLAFEDLRMMSDCILLRKITEKQIADSHKFSTAQLQDAYAEYSMVLDSLMHGANNGDPSTVIKNTIEYVRLEEFYQIDFFYNLSQTAFQLGVKDMPKSRILEVSGNVEIPPTFWCQNPVHIGSSMVLFRGRYLKDIFTMNDEEWFNHIIRVFDVYRIIHCLTLYAKSSEIYETISRTSLAEKADYLRHYYWIWDQRTNYKLSNKVIKVIRKLYSNMYLDLPKYKSVSDK